MAPGPVETGTQRRVINTRIIQITTQRINNNALSLLLIAIQWMVYLKKKWEKKVVDKVYILKT